MNSPAIPFTPFLGARVAVVGLGRLIVWVAARHERDARGNQQARQQRAHQHNGVSKATHQDQLQRNDRIEFMNPQTSMATASSTHAPSALTLQAPDGYALQALRYPARGPRVGHLLVAGATGVPQRHYRRFAEFAAERGLEVWTLDYRGIGLSKPPSLRGFRMDYRDWARLDLAAVVAEAAGDLDTLAARLAVRAAPGGDSPVVSPAPGVPGPSPSGAPSRR